jgi:membrane-bound lytic murein transglycosylase D
MLTVLLTGCAILPSRGPIEPTAPPAPVQTDQMAPSDQAPEPTSVRRVQSLLHSAFAAMDRADRLSALDSLAVASEVLIASYAPSGQNTTGQEPLERAVADDLTRAAIDIYYDALSGPEPLTSKSSAAQLIRALPSQFHSALSINDRYRHLYTKMLAGTSPIRIDVNERVLEKIAFFQKNDQRIFRTWMRRMGAYGPLIRQTLREGDIPEDLLFLSMIESGFNTKAYSKARAVGMWQFVSHTGRLYGLRRDTWIDERRDPEKATRAAARHIKHLYNLFGDWQLVITSYNCGQGRLQRAIRTDGSHDFWKLDSLPKETRNHLPKLMAVLLMSRDPEFFGVDHLVYDDPLAFDVVQVADPIDLRIAAQCAGTTYERMRALNSELRLGYSPPMPARKTYALRIPIGASDRFIDRYARIPAEKKVQLIDYKVRSGDTVSNIALSFGVRSSVIMDANGIRNPRRLRSGQKLKIPIQPKQSKRARAVANRTPSLEPGLGNKLVYRVKRGDTLWDIAKGQGVTADQIRAWNALRATGHIHPGDKLTIWPAAGRRKAASPALASVERYHKVRRGDTLWEIARIYDTSIRELKRLNEIRNASQIKAGDRLRVRSASAAVE